MKPIEAATVVRHAHQPPVEAAVPTENTAAWYRLGTLPAAVTFGIHC
ncbi:MAG: hypothetical protein LBS86_07230 [Treponema sp.]|nr:hypothetical protein [Treponema sp.]